MAKVHEWAQKEGIKLSDGTRLEREFFVGERRILCAYQDGEISLGKIRFYFAMDTWEDLTEHFVEGNIEWEKIPLLAVRIDFNGESGINDELLRKKYTKFPWQHVPEMDRKGVEMISNVAEWSEEFYQGNSTAAIISCTKRYNRDRYLLGERNVLLIDRPSVILLDLKLFEVVYSLQKAWKAEKERLAEEEEMKKLDF